MNYKITNITNGLGKRDINFNKAVTIKYVDSMMPQSKQIMPNQTIFLTIISLPPSIKRMQSDGLLMITEISDRELKSIYSTQQPVKIVEDKKNDDIIIKKDNKKK